LRYTLNINFTKIKKTMKKTAFILLMLVMHNLYSQQITVTYAGKTTGNLLFDFKQDSVLQVAGNQGNVQQFTISATIRGYTEEQRSMGNKFSNAQKELINKVQTGSKIYIEDIKVRTKDSVISVPALVFRKDGICADLFRTDNYYTTDVYYLLKNPAIYAFPALSSTDSAQYKVESFKINSVQPDYYYEFESNSNRLTPEMLNFVRNARVGFWLSDIKVSDKNSKTVSVRDIEIKKDANIILRTKKQLLKAKKLDIIAPQTKLEIYSLRLKKSKTFENETDYYINSEDNTLTKEMKKYIENAQSGDIIVFSLNFKNAQGAIQSFDLTVQICNE